MEPEIEVPETSPQVPEEAVLEAEKEEERIASQSDMAKLYDAVKELTKAVVDMKDYTSKKWEETESWRKAGRFVLPFILTGLAAHGILA